MIRKSLIIVASLLFLYFVTLNSFGKQMVFSTALKFAINKEFTDDEDRDYRVHDVYVGFKNGTEWIQSNDLLGEFISLKPINSESELETVRKIQDYAIVIIKPKKVIELGIVDVGINLIRGNYTGIHYVKKYLWCFFFWIDLKGYERRGTE